MPALQPSAPARQFVLMRERARQRSNSELHRGKFGHRGGRMACEAAHIDLDPSKVLGQHAPSTVLYACRGVPDCNIHHHQIKGRWRLHLSTDLQLQRRVSAQRRHAQPLCSAHLETKKWGRVRAERVQPRLSGQGEGEGERKPACMHARCAQIPGPPSTTTPTAAAYSVPGAKPNSCTQCAIC